MFCSNCGKEIDDNVKFGQQCGASYTNNETTTQKRDTHNENSGCLTQIGSLLGGIIFLAIIFNIGGFDFLGISDTNNGKGVSLEVTESHSCNLGYGARGICGTVKNNSNRNIGYAHVEINLYDKAGNLIGSTLDNVNNLEANSVWKFQAPIIEDNVATYKVKNVVGY